MSGGTGERAPLRADGPVGRRRESAPRTPVVLGVGPRVGATTLAAALHAHDGGQGDIAADVVVCAGTEESLRRAEALAFIGTRPLLAVVAAAGPGVVTDRLRQTGCRYASTTVLPHVEGWRGLAGPTEEIATLLGRRPERLPPALRAYADGLRALAAGMLRSGQLDRDRPPEVSRPVVVPRRRSVPARRLATVVVPQQRAASADAVEPVVPPRVRRVAFAPAHPLIPAPRAPLDDTGDAVGQATSRSAGTR